MVATDRRINELLWAHGGFSIFDSVWIVFEDASCEFVCHGRL